MKNKHTPAPWYAVNYSGFINIQSTDYYEATNILDEDICKEAIANGVLVSCAPEMFELIELVHKSFGGGNVITFSNEDISNFELVYNKATGQEIPTQSYH